MEKILQGVRHFQQHVFPKQADLFRKLAGQQRPRALFITCSDSRVHPNLITQTEPGDLFILRNPGNIVPPYHAGGDSESATIEYAVEVLEVADIIVCGHSNCGAMSALLRKGDLEHLPAVLGWLQHAEGTRRILLQVHAHRPEEQKLAIAIEQNVLVQLDHLRTHPSVAARLASGGLNLHAWVYEIASGDVSAYDQGRRRFMSLAATEGVPAAPTVAGTHR
jgi:carbonic anhydrase